MQDREFEKQVNQKMQELHFAPNPEVWAKVQADLQKKKKRRPVIIWFLLFGLILGGSGLWYMNGWNEKNEKAETKQAKQTEQRSTSNNNIQHAIASKQEVIIPARKKEIIADQPIANTSQEPTFIQQPATPKPQKTEPLQRQIAITIKQPDTTQKNNPPKQNKTKKKNTWQFGIATGAGISDIGQQLLRGSHVADFALNSVTPSSAFNQPRASEVNAGTAFQIGAYASKGIGKRFGLKLGLGYEYYSTSIRVGSLYNAPRIVNQGTDMKMVNEYYTPGNASRYANKYHFVSLPVSLQLKMSDKIVWENGISVSRLIAATALHYDGIGGTYYKDNGLFNRTQWSASSSLLFSFKSKNLQLYAGPHVQYGISNLVDGNNSHLRYAGLKLMAGFNKK